MASLGTRSTRALIFVVACGCGGSLAYYGPGSGADPGNPDGSGTSDPATSGDGEPGTPTIGTDVDTDTDTDVDTDTDTAVDPTTTYTPPPPPWANGDPGLPPPYVAQPQNQVAAVCAAIGLDADLDDNEVDVLSHDNSPELRTLTSPVAGWYDLYDRQMSKEEDGEWNESAMVRIVNAANPDGLPVLENCLGNWVTVDPDNYVDPGDDLFYMGTFWFEAGDNDLELEHLCPTVRAGSCGALEFLDDDDTTCGSGDGNSAHLDGTHLCLVAPAP